MTDYLVRRTRKGEDGMILSIECDSRILEREDVAADIQNRVARYVDVLGDETCVVDVVYGPQGPILRAFAEGGSHNLLLALPDL